MRLARSPRLLFFALPLLGACSKHSAPSADSNAAVTPTATPAATPVPSAEASATRPESGEVILFKKKDLVAGATYSEVAATTTQLQITAPQMSSVSQKQTITSKVTLLAVDGRNVAKVKIAYSDHTTLESKAGKTETKTDPVKGKTYIAEYKNKKTLVTTDDQKPVSAKERKTVQADLADILGKPDPLLTAVPDKPLKVGDRVDSLAEVLPGLLAGDEDDKVELSDTSIVLDQIGPIEEERAGIFTIKAKAKVSGKQQLEIDLSGSMSIRESDSRLLLVRLNGPLRLSAGTVNGQGGVIVALKRTY